jgi:hypothetical protein
VVAHELHPEVSAAPVEQGECEQVPPPEDVEVELVELVDVVLVAVGVEPPALVVGAPPHTFVFGMQTW